MDYHQPTLVQTNALTGSGMAETQPQKSAASLMAEGWRLWQTQQMDEAAVNFRQATELAPENADAWNGLGWADFDSGKTTEAEAAFKTALKLKPDQWARH